MNVDLRTRTVHFLECVQILLSTVVGIVYPPLLGGIAKLVRLATALLLPFVLCFALIPWTFFLLKGRR